LETKNTHFEHDLLEFHKAMTALEEQYKRKICEERKKSDKPERQFDDSKAEPNSAYLMSKNGPIVIDIPKGIPVADPRLRQGEWGHQDEGPQTAL